jgi:hypothetical protein
LITGADILAFNTLAAASGIARLEGGKAVIPQRLHCSPEVRDFLAEQFAPEGRFELLDVLRGNKWAVFDADKNLCGTSAILVYDKQQEKHYAVFSGLDVRDPFLAGAQAFESTIQSFRDEPLRQLDYALPWLEKVRDKHPDVIVGGFSTGTGIAYAAGALGMPYFQIEPSGASPSTVQVQSLAKRLSMEADAVENNLYENLLCRLLIGLNCYNAGAIDPRDIGKVHLFTPSLFFQRQNPFSTLVDSSFLGTSHLIAAGNPISNAILQPGEYEWCIERLLLNRHDPVKIKGLFKQVIAFPKSPPAALMAISQLRLSEKLNEVQRNNATKQQELLMQIAVRLDLGLLPDTNRLQLQGYEDDASPYSPLRCVPVNSDGIITKNLGAELMEDFYSALLSLGNTNKYNR